MDKTKSGIGLMQISFVLTIISNAIILSGIEGVLSGSEVDEATIQALESSMCFSLSVSLIAFAVLIYAVYKIYKDSTKFSSSHRDSVKFAIAFYLLGFILGLAYTPLETFLFAVGTIFLVKEIAPSFEKKLLWSAGGVNILTGVGFVIMFSIGFEREVSLKVLSYQVYWIMLSSAIGYLIFIIAYKRINSQLIDQADYSSIQEEMYTETEEPPKNCPRCGEDSLKVREGGFALCSECGYAKEAREVKDEG
ncbi:MAG: hypothetical protein ACLFSM_05145 [Thermoplasmata archaeon]